MSVMNCDRFLNQLERWMEGDRGADAEAHLRTCAGCSGLVEDLNSIHMAGRSIGAVEEAPAERVWLSLRAQLEQEGLIREGGTAESRSWMSAVTDWLAEVFSAVPRPALAGAYLAAIAAIGITLAHPGYQRSSSDQKSTGTLSARLDTAEHDTMAIADSDPVVAETLHKNLAIVDKDIALCEKSVQQDPDSEIARDYLYDAYRQKAGLLAQISQRGDGQ